MLKKQNAFTLVELSIVILIMGLIVAGVTAGSSLVSGAKSRKFISDTEKYKSAIVQFKSQYNYLPGDFPGSYSYWGAGCGANTVGASDSCNGNGNGAVEFTAVEDIKLWYHLMRAGLINLNMSGALVGGSYSPGVNTPRSVYGGTSAYQVFYTDPSATNFGRYGNALQIGSNGGRHQNTPFISPVDAYKIDLKIDDGTADKGIMFTLKGIPETGGVCVTANWTAASASYILTDKTNSCRIIFWID